MQYLKKLWNEKPFLCIILAGLFFRLLAVFFSKGYAMMDDHYLVIEQAQKWVDHYDDNRWLPQFGGILPSGHSLFYVGIHYVLFQFLEWLSIIDPQIKMVFIRLIHAAFSFLIIIFGYKITKHLSNVRNAKVAGILLSLVWLFPFLSVRNLVEFTCIPFFLWGLWLVVKNIDLQKKLLVFFIAGFICGLSMSVRFQAALLVLGLFIAILAKKKWIPAIVFGFGAASSFIALQGIIDSFVWGKPFAEFFEYIKYNVENRFNYFTGNWYNYILLILGLLIPPISFFLFFGWLRTWKKYFLVFFPAFLFLLFHMYFPNRQERFILPVLPLIIITGIIGWNEFVDKSNFWKKRKKLLQASWIFFWILNIILLIPLSVTYTKRSYVEAMNYLKNKNVTEIVVDDMNHDSNPIMPRYYLGNWNTIYYSSGIHPYAELVSAKKYFISNNVPLPNYFVFLETENLQQRVDSLNIIFPGLVKDTIIEPGFIDKVMHFLNKRNKNQHIVIYHRNDKNL
jgi:hypothetical protein